MATAGGKQGGGQRSSIMLSKSGPAATQSITYIGLCKNSTGNFDEVLELSRSFHNAERRILTCLTCNDTGK
jgi:hypothetical protein